MEPQLLTINGLTCESCTRLSSKRIRLIEGVEDASVDLDSKLATIRAVRPISVEEVNDALADLHYRAEVYHA